jgi:hypothetical protein
MRTGAPTTQQCVAVMAATGPTAAPILNDKQLTAAIKNATSPERLADLARAHEGCVICTGSYSKLGRFLPMRADYAACSCPVYAKTECC